MERSRLHGILRGFGIGHRDSRRAVNVNCPFCVGRTSGRRDDKFRCGIFPDSLRFHCFRCKRWGSFYAVLSALADVSPAEYRRIVGGREQHWGGGGTGAELRRRREAARRTASEGTSAPDPLPSSRVHFPAAYGAFPELRRWLDGRHISPETCGEYGASYIGSVGRYCYRLILPVIGEDGGLEAWQARDVTGRAKAKYLTSGRVDRTLYWATHMREPYRLYVVEGALDVWRLGYNAVASFTKSLSTPQRASLARSGAAEEIVLCWDADAWRDARAAAWDLAAIFPRVGVARLPEGEDPDSYGAEAVRNMPIRWL